MATWLTRAQVAGTNRKICTISMWIKKCENSAGHEQYLFHSWADGNNRFMVALQNDDTLQVRERSGGNTTLQIDTNRKFRDTNAWYHIVVRVDTTQSTAADRIRMYINGVQETSFSGASYPNQNLDLRMGTTDYTFYLGQYGGGGNNFSGVASHWHFADGQSLAPTVFGSTDATTGEWKINTSPTGITYGNNGFFLFKDDNSVNDDSGEGHNFTLASGTLTKTEDCPSNVFATFNPLNIPTSNAPVFAAGNTDLDSCGNAALFHGSSTLGMPQNSGKFYAEFKWKSGSYPIAGVSSRARNDARENSRVGGETGSYGFELYNGAVKTNNSTIGGLSLSSLSTNDILCIAIDCENSKIYFRKNAESWMNSGDPTSGSTGTGAISLTAAGSGDNDGFWFFEIGDGSTSSSSKISANFGNGYFLTTAVSSAGTNASNNGIFEYDVPSGYTALSTKGLNL